MAKTTKEREKRRKRAVRMVRREHPGAREYVATLRGDGSIIVECWGEKGTEQIYRVQRGAV